MPDKQCMQIYLSISAGHFVPMVKIVSAAIEGAAHVAYFFQKDDTGVTVRELKMFASLILFLTFEKTHQLDDVTRFRTRKRAVTVGHLHQFARGRDQEL